MTGLAGITAPERIFRVGRSPDPWTWPPWESQNADGTFGNRWDDPDGLYRVLYACSQLEGAFVEVLARFRPDPAVVATLAEIGGPDDTVRAGVVPAAWLTGRLVGEGSVPGIFADIGDAVSLAYLHRTLARRLIHYNMAELDAAAIRSTAPRRLTQEISNHVYGIYRGGRPSFVGIEYQSRLGDNYQNWAIFERPDTPDPVLQSRAAAIDAANPHLSTALTLLDLRLE